MKATFISPGFTEEKWVWMIALSLLFHLTALSFTLFLTQEKIEYPSIGERVYNVELVEQPGAPTGAKEKGGVVSKPRAAKKQTTSYIPESKAKRVPLNEKKAPPILAKRVSPKIVPKKKERSFSASELIDKAISKIEKGVRDTEKQESGKEEKGKFLSESESQESGFSKEGEGGGGSVPSPLIGKIILIYQMEIENIIKNNWSYPVALLDVKKGEIPEAVVTVKVKSSGEILDMRFNKKSADALFNNSVIKAIEKSDPLPEFPPGYKKRYDEIEITFNLEDLVE